jgi:hypothetical protein
MIQPRALEPFPELCCRPTPYRIFHYVAGMAFNFSKIEMSHFAPKQAQPSEPAKLPDDVVQKTL